MGILILGFATVFMMILFFGVMWIAGEYNLRQKFITLFVWAGILWAFACMLLMEIM